jgi:hypothetical protein
MRKTEETLARLRAEEQARIDSGQGPRPAPQIPAGIPNWVKFAAFWIAVGLAVTVFASIVHSPSGPCHEYESATVTQDCG